MDPSYPPQRPILPTHSRRSAVFARSHLVATSQPLATEIGHQILSHFPHANAADAAIAIAAALNVLEPGSCGVGGDMFCLYYSATDHSVKAINGSGRSPAALSLDVVRKAHPDAKDRLPPHSPHAITVPGAVMGWEDTFRRFGSGKVQWAHLLAPAIDLAEKGFPVSRISSAQWVGSEARLKAASPNAGEVLLPGTGKAPLEGEWMQMPNLAHTLREVADKGAKEGFYRGRIAEAIVAEVQRLGGVMQSDDLEAHESTFEDPISIDYGSVRLWECAPNGQGLVAILALAILDKAHELGVFPKRPEELLADHLATASSSPTVPTTYAHLLIQALGLAFAEAQAHITDPAIVAPTTTLAKLLSPTHLAHLARKLSATSRGAAGAGAPLAHTDTVYFSVGDAQGNACSFIFSNYMGFGHGAVPRGCGFTLQNRGCGFFLNPSTSPVNLLGPRKRAYHTIIPGMLTDRTSGALVAAMGVMGGYMQPQGHVQVLMQYLAAVACAQANDHEGDVKRPVARFGDPQGALDAKRFLIQPEERVEQLGRVVVPVYVEQGMLTREQREELLDLGHVIREVPLQVISMFGRGQWVGRVHADEATKARGGPHGWWVGASDGRADGCAFGA